MIRIVKIGLTRDMIIPEEVTAQPEISKNEIPKFYAYKRAIGIYTIIQELGSNFSSDNPVWHYYNRDNTLIYSNSRDIRPANMEEVRKWIMTLLNPEKEPITRAIRKEFISQKLLTDYCKIVSQRYPDHLCSRCNGDNNYILEIEFEG